MIVLLSFIVFMAYVGGRVAFIFMICGDDAKRKKASPYYFGCMAILIVYQMINLQKGGARHDRKAYSSFDLWIGAHPALTMAIICGITAFFVYSDYRKKDMDEVYIALSFGLSMFIWLMLILLEQHLGLAA